MASPYTREQVSQYLQYIDISSQYRLENSPECSYEFLKAIHVHTISAIPYENLAIHYSRTRTVSLDPQYLFEKIVGSARGRGGYCMENSLFILYMLRSLGFTVYPAGVKIRYRQNGIPQGPYIGHTHIVNIVKLPNGDHYHIDVSFGGDGATEPIPLIEGSTIRNMGTQDARLIKDFIPEQTIRDDPERKLWIYQCRNGEDKPWLNFYCFTDRVEWVPEDFEISNYFAGHRAESFQTFTVLCIKFLKRYSEEKGEWEVFGKRMLVNGTVKENLGGKTRVVKECLSEEERVEALREWFGLRLTKEETEGIGGYRTEILKN